MDHPAEGAGKSGKHDRFRLGISPEGLSDSLAIIEASKHLESSVKKVERNWGKGVLRHGRAIT